MPLQDAARAACVSHAFLSSWRCRPDITISWKTLGGKDEVAKDFNSIADQILKNRSGIGLKTLKIDFCDYKADTYSYLNNWLEIAITPELEELTLDLFPRKAKYSFPCSLLSNGRGNSLRHLKLVWCAFSNTVGLDCLKNLTSLHLHDVHITGNELGCLFSSSSALERLELHGCHKIVRLEIPCLLQRLRYLGVFVCERLKVIESKAPNISSFHLSEIQGKFSLGESSLQLKDMMLSMNCTISFARAKLPFIVPNLKSLSLASDYEVPNTPLVSKTFLHLKYLCISLSEGAFSPYYDCFSAVSFLDAAPSLETLRLGVTQLWMKHEPFVGEPSPQNQIMGTRHSNLKSVKITGFCSAKSLVELTCYILEYATSLDCLTLDTTWGCFRRCSDHGISKCASLTKNIIRDSRNALLVIRAWIEGKVPPSVKFNVLAHCSKCHNADED
ncbi:uncharacterized protein LOC8069211 isoform X3 [Sorghum bicolor]|nr:uncharacterized protein LOC8069211 isoform X3 [Sorghum bicolor]EER88978.1 hypothetical protein SORBI_3010G264900 [Sorghum bicolor]OQU77130.1 hypothetical protein SORBI_3010G264900 [Sorghum bicolor]|eukprot:XP_002437611.1 uncharacterized protein LOC8069211 isoform X3 [Sorghum bicolor]